MLSVRWTLVQGRSPSPEPLSVFGRHGPAHSTPAHRLLRSLQLLAISECVDHDQLPFDLHSAGVRRSRIGADSLREVANS
jgi:hypothetical protein